MFRVKKSLPLVHFVFIYEQIKRYEIQIHKILLFYTVIKLSLIMHLDTVMCKNHNCLKINIICSLK